MSGVASASVTSPQDILAQLTQKLGETQSRLEYAELKIQVLEERLRQMRIAKYGLGSEKLCGKQST